MKNRQRATLAGLLTSLVLISWTAFPASAHAQSWSFDAKTIALGGIGAGSGNIAASLINEQKPYRAIVIPLGLLQVLRDLDTFNPGSEKFDPIRGAEYSASPVHFVVGRDGTNTQSFFVTDILNGSLSRDLNDYRGFVPAGELTAGGIASPRWGKTINFKSNGSAFQGVYIGAGPYLSIDTRAAVSDQLRSILDSDAPIYVSNGRFDVSNLTTTQLAMAVTGGYRARIPFAGSGRELDGVYLAANYNFLKGFRYEAFDTALRLDTDAAGLLTFNSSLPAPLRISRNSSTSGLGFSIDVGTAIVINHWQFGFGANGLANHIDWRAVRPTLYSLGDLFGGDGDFEDSEAPVATDVRLEMPVDYRSFAAYVNNGWEGTAEWSRGLQGATFRGGLAKKLNRIELRGGGRYSRDRWEPSGGIGFDVSRRFGIDVAAFSSSANAERERRLAFAVSLRLMHN